MRGSLSHLSNVRGPAQGNAGIDLLAEQFAFRRAAVDWTAKARTAKRGEI